jgi:hypothetical protein
MVSYFTEADPDYGRRVAQASGCAPPPRPPE